MSSRLRRSSLIAVIAVVAAVLPVASVAAAEDVCDAPFTPVYEIQGSGDSSPLLPAAEQFLSYEGAFTADGGPADGMLSEDIGVSESNSTPVDSSLQLTGTGSAYTDFTWAGPAADTFGSVNTDQDFTGAPPAPFINEIHYDNAGGDTGEGVEIAGPAGADLSGWSLVFYNGNGGGDYKTVGLSGVIPDQDDGAGTLSFAVSSIQNGAPDGIALVTSSIVTTQGVVTADFQKQSELSAFFIQDVQGDKDPSTSDGIFVFHRDTFEFDVEVGEIVRFTAEVSERFGQTQLSFVEDLVVCGSGSVNPTKVILPVDDLDRWESVEGMLVDLPQKLHVTANFTQARFGEVDLSFNRPLDTPTNVVAPGAAANALQDQNDRSRIQLEDGSRVQNPSSPPYFYDDPKTLRLGDTTKQKLTGVITFDFGAYELQPTSAVEFQPKNGRPDGSPSVKGDLRVASFNVLNFFTTIDPGFGSANDICGPTGMSDCRGADSTTEYDRQLAKLLAGIVELDADVIGLQEVENDVHPVGVDGSRAHDAILTLVEELNAIEGSGTWAWFGVPTVVVIGDPGSSTVPEYNDYPIRNEIIYRTAAVEPVAGSDPMTLQDIAFNATRGSDFEPVGRPPIAQAFADKSTSEEFTVVVNHFKSKGSPCDVLSYGGVFDVDTGDGQANCNLTRVAQAEALLGFIDELIADSGDSDVLIIGDLNSYAMEDPVATLTGAGYTDLVDKYNGSGWAGGAYSFQFFGQSGYLDHALASPTMVSQAQDTTLWHINSDEPRGLDYNTFNQPELYVDDQFRSSDHDPVVIGLRLR